MGSVTTGEPDTAAQVSNSGTEQAAVLDFVIPRGATGSGSIPPVEALSAFSTPPQSAASAPLIFDRNAVSYGNDITHAVNSANFSIQTPGVYFIAFHGTVTPSSESTFPMTVLIRATLNGTGIPGVAVQHVFNAANGISNPSFTGIVTVSTAPATLQISAVNTGSNSIQYSGITLNIYRLGDIPTT